MRGNYEVRDVGVVGSLDVTPRGPIVAVRMRMVDAEEFETGSTNLAHQTEELFGRNFVGNRRTICHISSRKRVTDRAVVPREQATAFLIRITSRVVQNLSRNVSRESNFVHRVAVTLDDFSLLKTRLAFPLRLI